jgi:hypothetical protein
LSTPEHKELIDTWASEERKKQKILDNMERKRKVRETDRKRESKCVCLCVREKEREREREIV